MIARAEISRRNLFDLSMEKSDFSIAVREWRFEGIIEDHGSPSETCELCENEQLRYHFEIRNTIGNILQVGSSCIHKFDIPVIDGNGNEVKKNKLHYLEQLRKRQGRMAVLEKLRSLGRQGILAKCSIAELDDYCYQHVVVHDQCDACILRYLFRVFELEGVSYEPRDFKILKNDYDSRTKLLKLKRVQFDRIILALSKSQREYWLKAKGFNVG